ncbi:N-acetyltransferase DgcN [Qipengyuania sediminis]|uniref:N-acetyltransferase DgcN n=1 Tax=Qipengyuania sediminis TaxID=1532023 RepID=UPI0010595642|nr:N-acetyltransferase DgcN [Qipengyuania sediminis]
MIEPPFLLYLGRSTDPVGIKTSRGLATFRPRDCVGEFRHDDCPLTLGLPRLSMDDAAARGAKTLVLGIAHAGGAMAPALIEDAHQALAAGLHVASGLHHRLRGVPSLVAFAKARGLRLIDVRDPPPDLQVGTGMPRRGRRLLTVGTDCSVGKMYASLALAAGLRDRGAVADFRATGQTGILIAGGGVPVDAVVADFISGAIEQLTPARTDAGWDVIEGQGSLFHPSFAGVSLGLLHGAQPEALVLCHDPARREMRGLPGRHLPDLEDCLARNLEAARLTSPQVYAAGICLNTAALDEAAACALCVATEDRLALPVTDPHRFGTDPILDFLCTAPSPSATTASR